MNKADLIDSVASATGLGKPEAGSAVESVLNVITSALQRGESQKPIPIIGSAAG